MAYTDRDIDELIDEAFGGRTIAFKVSLAHLIGSVTAALLLSQFLYWSKGRTTLPGGWFWKTVEELTEETGLSYEEQRTARRLLLTLCFIHEDHRGVPQTLHFRVRKEILRDAILGHLRGLTPQQLVETFAAQLKKMSHSGYERALKLGRPAEMVDYATILVRDSAICGLCRKQIVRGPGKKGDQLSFDHKSDDLIDGLWHTAANIHAVHAECNLAKQTARRTASSRRTRDQLWEKPIIESGESPELNLGVAQNQSSGLPRSIPEITSETTTNTSIPPAGPSLRLTPPSHEDLRSVQGSAEPDPHDEKLASLKHAIDFMWDPDVPLDWGKRDERAANDIIADRRSWSRDQFAVAVVNRFQSRQINRSKPPRTWLKKLPDYLLSPLDQYNQPIFVTDQQIQDHRAEVLRMLKGGREPVQQKVLPYDSARLKELNKEIDAIRLRKRR